MLNVPSSNKSTWEKPDVVDYYSNDNQLQAPEKTILNILKDQLPNMKMLDIGIGAGRTVANFSHLVKSYDGIDYSEEMVKVCKKDFPEKEDQILFQVCDARDMSIFEDSSFDFILFSYNGIDYISHEDRLKVFSEIKRVGKKGAVFCFSTHNLDSVNLNLAVKPLLTLNPKQFLRTIRDWYLFKYRHNKKLNQDIIKNNDYLIIKDGAHDYRLNTYYIRPSQQILQLKSSDISNDVQVFSLESGRKIDLIDGLDDSWLYYLCKLSSKA